MVQERSAFDGFIEETEAPKIDGALLISLLEESPCEEFNDEQLQSVMQSLEEEISVTTTVNHHCAMQPEFVSEVNRNCGNLEYNFGYFEWNDMEMGPSSPSDDMNWYIEHRIEAMDEMMEFIGESYSQNYYAVNVPLEEHGYTSLWQETYDTVM